MACAATGSGVAPSRMTRATAAARRPRLRLIHGEDAEGDAGRVVDWMKLDRELAAARRGEDEGDGVTGMDDGRRHGLVVAVDVEDAVHLGSDLERHVLVATHARIVRSQLGHRQRHVDRDVFRGAARWSVVADATRQQYGEDEKQERP